MLRWEERDPPKSTAGLKEGMIVEFLLSHPLEYVYPFTLTVAHTETPAFSPARLSLQPILYSAAKTLSHHCHKWHSLSVSVPRYSTHQMPTEEMIHSKPPPLVNVTL